MLAALFAWVVVGVVLAVIVGFMASARGRVGYGWFLLSLALSPLITGPLVLALPRHTQPQRVTAGAILKWFAITILFGCVVVAGMFVLALFLIVQHGGG